MDGVRSTVPGADGVDIGLLTAGTGPSLLLVHGGPGQIESWQTLWDRLSAHWRVTAMDRRGRGSSGDGQGYSIESEYGDVAAVASVLAADGDGTVDVFGHSFGATCTLGAASRPAPIRRIALYEPPAARSVSPEFVDRLTALVEEGRAGRAMVMFLMEIMELTTEEVDQLKNAPLAYDILSVVSATLPREGAALLDLTLSTSARGVTCPTMFLLGERSPQWAKVNTDLAAAVIPDSQVMALPDLGHDAIDTAPDLVVDHLARFFGSSDAG